MEKGKQLLKLLFLINHSCSLSNFLSIFIVCILPILLCEGLLIRFLMVSVCTALFTLMGIPISCEPTGFLVHSFSSGPQDSLIFLLHLLKSNSSFMHYFQTLSPNLWACTAFLIYLNSCYRAPHRLALPYCWEGLFPWPHRGHPVLSCCFALHSGITHSLGSRKVLITGFVILGKLFSISEPCLFSSSV